MLVNICDMAILALCLQSVYHVLDVFYPGAVDIPNFAPSFVLGLLCYIPVAVLIPPAILRRMARVESVMSTVMLTSTFFIALYMVVFYLCKETSLTRTFMICLYVSFSVLLMIERLLARFFLVRQRARGFNTSRILLVGKAEEMSDLYNDLSVKDYGMKVEGLFTDSPEDVLPEEMPYLGKINEVLPYLQGKKNVDAVYCSMSSMSKMDAIELYRYCENNVIHFFALPAYLSFFKRNMVVTTIGSSVLLSSRTEPLRDLGNRSMKRAVDILLSGLLLAFVFPVIYLFVALVIKRQSSGPVFSIQKRGGLNGHVFGCIKFRCVHTKREEEDSCEGAEENAFFPFGKFLHRSRIEELPQLINVLFGEMSMVGPRPHLLSHAEEYQHIINRYSVRYWVKPGLTGWAQINKGQNSASRFNVMEKCVHEDIWYIENWSFWLDVRIIVRSIMFFFFGK